MIKRPILAFVMVVVALLALASPALAGGWATVTLDALPKAVRAGEQFQLGFVIRQHGKTPTNKDLDGRPMKPILTAHRQTSARSATLLVAGAPSVQFKGEESIRVEARQQGAVGHFVADITFPSEGGWEWQIEVPTFYVQNDSSGQGGNAAIFEPLTVLAASAAPAQAAVPAPVASAPVAPAEPTLLGLSPAALRWGGIVLLLIAAGVALASQRGLIGRRVARSR
jgi:hypothetical protein